MTEARKLDPGFDPSSLEKASEKKSSEEAQAFDPPIALDKDSESLAPKAMIEASLAETIDDSNERPGILDRFSNVFMVLFLSGAFSFALGMLAAAAVVLGILDLQTVWLKEMLKTIKTLAVSMMKHSGPDPGDF